jgi:hypothetical protein
MVRTTLVIFGILVIVAALNDMFQSAIVPRSAVRRIRPSFYQTRFLWSFWPRLIRLRHPHNAVQRQDGLAVFAPLNLVLNMVLWSLLIIVGFGMIFYALREHVRPPLTDFAQALYFAGTSFFTIGFGDFVGNTGFTRLTSLAAGASGFTIISMVTAYIFGLFGAFQTREQFVTLICVRGGNPLTGVGLLARSAHGGVIADFATLMRGGESWCAALIQTHTAYPILAYFRSNRAEDSWIGTLGALLDAAALTMTTVVEDGREAHFFFDLARLALTSLGDYFGVVPDREHIGIGREHFEEACDRLAAAGLQLHGREIAWARFADLRRGYAGYLTALARYFDVAPLHWLETP